MRRKPDESRLDLINRNTDLFVGILDEIKKVGTKPGAICVVVSNPVDILTYVAAKKLGLPATHVIGLGTQLDTIRFCSLIADALGTAPTQTKGLILGEHGDSMVPFGPVQRWFVVVRKVSWLGNSFGGQDFHSDQELGG